jgi:hypothetical protein
LNKGTAFTIEERKMFDLVGLLPSKVASSEQQASLVYRQYQQQANDLSVSVEAYERPSFGYQATNEIVQALVRKGFIERDTLEYIKLTAKGLDKCKEDCR